MGTSGSTDYGGLEWKAVGVDSIRIGRRVIV